MRHFVLFIFLLIGGAAFAQQPGEKINAQREEKLRALYVAYMTQQMNLSADEAQKFWPVHAQYEAELRAANANKADELARQQEILNIKKKYRPSFNNVVGNERSNQFFRQDAEFRKKMVERLKQMREQRQANGGQRGAFKRNKQ